MAAYRLLTAAHRASAAFGAHGLAHIVLTTSKIRSCAVRTCTASQTLSTSASSSHILLSYRGW